MKSTTVKNRILTPVRSVVAFARGHIHETIRIRDKHQFELRLHYPLKFEAEVSKLDLESYLFLPNGLGVHRINFSKEKFYDDLYTEIRLKTPLHSLSELTKPNNLPLLKLKTSVDRLIDAEGSDREVEYRLKLFCCILQTSLKNTSSDFNKLTEKEIILAQVNTLLLAAKTITEELRAMKQRLHNSETNGQLIQLFKFGDEYVSLLFEQSAYAFAERLESLSSDSAKALKHRLIHFLQHELNYREDQNYPTVPSDRNSYEYYVFRRSKLKMYMHSVLTLDTKKNREGNLFEHIMFAIAGGISMIFATAALFISQSFYGSLTIPVFAVLVVSYMFKDRIKELLRVYFSKLKSNYLYDHKTKIYRNNNTLIGLCRESFDYISQGKLPSEIFDIRHSNYQTEVETTWLNESVIRYRKQIKLYSKQIQATHKDLDLSDINDILRFDFSEFARRMGVPDEDIHVLNEDGIKKIKAQRVYHINLVLRYVVEGQEPVYKRLRIVLNRRNIKRVEVVRD